MSPAIVLAIVVATRNVDDQATEAMRATAAEAIGGEDSVAVREVETPSDREAMRIERSVHALSVAQVIWLDPARTRAQVRVHVAETNRWTERAITFAVVDTPVERGRALGFAVTSMLPEEALSARPHRLAIRPTAPADVPGPAATPPPAGPQTALRLGAIGSTGLGGTAKGVGASIAAEFLLTKALSLRLAFARRVGSVPPLSGDDVAINAGVGLAFWPVRPSVERRVAVGLRVDALALYHGVSHEAAGVVTRLPKWLPGVDALAEVGFSVVRWLEIVASLGVEVAIGNTDLQVDDGLVATIPPLRGVAEAGIRVSF